MTYQELIGTIYTMNVKIRRERKSCANFGDFSTYDPFIDAYRWCEYGEYHYLVTPAKQKGGMFSLTVYLQVVKHLRKAHLQNVTRALIEERFCSKLCGVRVDHVGVPHLFLRPVTVAPHEDTEPELRSEKIFDMIIHG